MAPAVGPGIGDSLLHEIALGFIARILSGAQRLAHVAFPRADPMLCPLLAVSQIASQSTLSRFFTLFAHAGIAQRAFTPLWEWGDGAPDSPRRAR